ncbi:hypothetical protein [Helicobacter felis]|uniref:hypothetical protein n=1 Tax=Helicobacter felis TaxID=214 RepID=UPI000CF17E06|nr:hypothetical protein [Helicobacter felis]
MNPNTTQEKIQVLQECAQEITKMRESAQKQVRESQEEANYHKGAMASRYDTFKEEAQYLVAAGEKRVADLTLALNLTQRLCADLQNQPHPQKVALGACVIAQRDDKKLCFFVVPFAAHSHAKIAGQDFVLVNPKAPLYQAFKDLSVGDVAEDDSQRFEDFEILEIF